MTGIGVATDSTFVMRHEDGRKNEEKQRGHNCLAVASFIIYHQEYRDLH
jgi:hypothetical protein